MKCSRFSILSLVIVSWLLVFNINSYAVYHEYSSLPSGKKTISYVLMQQLSFSYQSSAINVDLGGLGEEGRNLELSLMGYRTPYLISNSVYQLELMGKQKIMSGGPLSFTGVLGMGALYSSVAFSACGIVGNIIALDPFPGLKFSVPLIANIFSDGVLLDYSGGLALNPPQLGGREIIVGAKGVMMLLSSGSFMGFQNSFYAMAGLRMPL